jgi:hypothetical protein
MSTRLHGIALLYAIVVMVGLCAILSLALDLGHVQLAKSELHRAADSAARAGAAGLLVDSTEASIQASRFAGYNDVDGLPLALDPTQDIEIGSWNSAARKFIKGGAPTYAIHITARKSPARGDGVSLMLTSLLGLKSCSVTAESVALVSPPIDLDESVPAVGNPFLAGMPAGSVASANNPHQNPDYAGTAGNPRQSPLPINLPLVPGEVLTFDSISGTARHDPGLSMFQPDGEISDIGHNNATPDGNNSYTSTFYNENGIADMKAPINALVGVFLDDNQPNLTPAPAKNLDFSTSASRDFSTLKPDLKQIFFIGDGMNSNGQTQEFVVPQGATRLFLATWDFYEWNNNAGARDVVVIRPMRIVTVK